MITARIVKFRKDNKGAALVELAIITPILLLLVMGIVEVGWIFNGYITLTGAAREGARIAAVDENGDYNKAVENHINSLSRLSVNSITKSGGGNQGDNITVKVEGGISLLFGILPYEGAIPLKTEATMRRQYRD